MRQQFNFIQELGHHKDTVLHAKENLKLFPTPLESFKYSSQHPSAVQGSLVTNLLSPAKTSLTIGTSMVPEMPQHTLILQMLSEATV